MKREVTLLITVTLALVATGVLMIYSVTAVGIDSTGLLTRQVAFVGLGLLAMYCGARFDYHRLRDPFVFRGLVIVAALLLLLVLIPGVGLKVNGARRWLFGFQPAEVAKFALIALLAVKLTENHDGVRGFWSGFVPPMLIAGSFSVLVLLERDLGTPVMMMGAALVMMFLAGVRTIYLAASVAPLAGAVALLVYYAPHRLERLLAFIDPWAHRDGAGWHLIQSLAGFAQGGVFGRGLGAGEQKLGYLPAAHTDFIFSVIGEEGGLISTWLVVLLFAAFVFAAFRISMRAPDVFGALLAGGIGALIGMQAVFVMAVTTGLSPTKGLPLPFISYGGTALIVFLGLCGVLANIGVQAGLPEPKRRLAVAA